MANLSSLQCPQVIYDPSASLQAIEFIQNPLNEVSLPKLDSCPPPLPPENYEELLKERDFYYRKYKALEMDSKYHDTWMRFRIMRLEERCKEKLSRGGQSRSDRYAAKKQVFYQAVKDLTDASGRMPKIKILLKYLDANHPRQKHEFTTSRNHIIDKEYWPASTCNDWLLDIKKGGFKVVSQNQRNLLSIPSYFS